MRIRALFAASLLVLSSCSLGETSLDDAALRTKFAARTTDKTAQSLYSRTLLINVVVGAVSQAIPGLHLAGLVVDVVVLVNSFDDLIYGTGAILARERACPNLVESADYRNVLGAWFKGIHTSGEFETAMSLGVAVTPLVTRETSAELFGQAIATHGAKFVGPKLAGVIGAKVATKAAAGFLFVLGPTVAAGINWFITSGIHDAATSYYETKARLVCPR